MINIIKSILRKLPLIKYVYKFLSYCKYIGFISALKKVKAYFILKKPYNYYYRARLVFSKNERLVQEKVVFPKNIKFSILVPLYNTPKRFLIEMIDSLQLQTYKNWELCLADGSDSQYSEVEIICRKFAKKDKRIIYKKLETNLGISGNSNACIDMATGEYIGLLDHDDILHPSALYENVKAICETDADFLYSDEATFKNRINKIVTLHFKPDFAIDNLRANNYICHFSAFKRELINKAGKFRSEFDGSQDHDMVLRLTASAKIIYHIPKVLYFWRSHPNSTSFDIVSKKYAVEAGKNAVKEHLLLLGMAARVESSRAFPTIYRIIYEIAENPLVSIIILNKDNIEYLKKCIRSIITNSTYTSYEIIVVENNSKNNETFVYYEEIKKLNNVKIIYWENEFNFSEINNYAVKFSQGKHLIFLNNDIEIITGNWIEEMLMYSQRRDVGAVGAKLYYPDNTIQHAGVVIGLGADRIAGHIFYKVDKGNLGYMGKLEYAQNMSAVTAACMMMRRSVFDEVRGFDPQFKISYNDIDLCLRIRKAGYLIVWTPYAELYHYESKSRGLDNNKKNRIRFMKEVDLFKGRWSKELVSGDPYYNINLTLDRSDYSLKLTMSTS